MNVELSAEIWILEARAEVGTTENDLVGSTMNIA